VMSNLTFWSVFSLFLDVVMYLDDNTFVGFPLLSVARRSVCMIYTGKVSCAEVAE